MGSMQYIDVLCSNDHAHWKKGGWYNLYIESPEYMYTILVVGARIDTTKKMGEGRMETSIWKNSMNNGYSRKLRDHSPVIPKGIDKNKYK